MGISEIGATLKYRRKSLGITQPDLAEMAGISHNTLYKIERGQANPTVRVLVKLAGVLGMALQLVIRNLEQA